MASNIIKLKSPNGNSVIEVSKDMEEYYLKMGYTKVSGTDKKPSSFSNNAKLKTNKDK